MHRAPLLRLLADYAERHPGEATTTGRFIAFVSAHPDCFERALAVGHVTASAWILDGSRTRVLLTHHRKLNRWLQPGGHADGDPNVAATAAREALEETGLAGLVPDGDAILDLDIHPIPARDAVPAHLHYDVRFLFRASGSPDFIVSDESHDLAWVPLDRLHDFTTQESVLRLAAKSV